MALIRSARLASTARFHRTNPVDQIQWTAPAAAQSADGGASSAPPRP
jgi:hypothetical protein